MNEEISTHVAALNAAWQHYARAIEQQLDIIPMQALNRDYLAAREGLAACGIEERTLVYDPATLTFSLPGTSERTEDDFATVTFSVPTDMPDDGRWNDDDLDIRRMQLL
jgi:hypothetical protein